MLSKMVHEKLKILRWDSWHGWNLQLPQLAWETRGYRRYQRLSVHEASLSATTLRFPWAVVLLVRIPQAEGCWQDLPWGFVRARVPLEASVRTRKASVSWRLFVRVSMRFLPHLFFFALWFLLLISASQHLLISHWHCHTSCFGLLSKPQHKLRLLNHT